MGSYDDLRYGLELARLSKAHIDVKAGYSSAKRPGVALAVLQDIQVRRITVVLSLILMALAVSSGDRPEKQQPF